MISKQYGQNALLHLCKQCVGDAGAHRCTIARISPLSTRLGYLSNWVFAREGIESHPPFQEFKDIFEILQKVTLKSTPQEEWLLVNVLGRSPPQSRAPVCRTGHRPEILDELNHSGPFHGPTYTNTVGTKLSVANRYLRDPEVGNGP